MTLKRRKFLQKTFFGCLSVSVLPASFSLLCSENDVSYIDDLFSRLSIKQGSLTLDKITRPDENNEIKTMGSGRAMIADKSVYIRERFQTLSRTNEDLVRVYQKKASKLQHVISLDQWELKALHKMMTRLMDQYSISDPKQLRALLIPVLRKNIHRSRKNHIDGQCSSQFGYYTDFGYCSIGMKVNESHMEINAALLDSRKNAIYTDNFYIHSIA